MGFIRTKKNIEYVIITMRRFMIEKRPRPKEKRYSVSVELANIYRVEKERGN